MTRYPLVASMNLSTESSCSLSSTQRMIFLGRMMFGVHSFIQIRLAGGVKTRLRAPLLGGVCDSVFLGVAHESACPGSDSCVGKGGDCYSPGGLIFTPSVPAIGDLRGHF